MEYIGRRIYFDKGTGNVILDTGERSGDVIETTVDQDFESFIVLMERVRETVGVIQFAYGEYAQDFMQCNGYRVNPETLALEFSYPDPNAPMPEPVYQEPLTEQVAELKRSAMSPAEIYESTDNSSLTLDELKELKIGQLKYLCEQDILAGFDFTINGILYHFSFDVEAQMNFNGANSLFVEGLITEVEWTVTNNGQYERIILDKPTFDQIKLVAFNEKNNKIKRLRNDILPLVEVAESKSDVEVIVW